MEFDIQNIGLFRDENVSGPDLEEIKIKNLKS